MHSHLQDFAHELIARHGPRTSGMIWQAFTNVGNFVPGTSVSDQIASVEKALKGDDRLSFEDAKEGREGGLFSHRDNHNDN